MEALYNKLRRWMNPTPTVTHCPACDKDIERFLPLPADYLQLLKDKKYRFSLDDAETLNADNYNCPNCYSTDRDRMIVLYLEQLLQNPKGHWLHVAPAPSITLYVHRTVGLQQTTVDLAMEGVDYHASLTDLSIFSDDTFDGVICSHVLEHIEEDQKAIAELYRVLKPGGRALLLVPIHKQFHADLKVPGDKDPNVRWEHYGQDDHVRFYSRQGFVNLIEGAGFSVQLFSPNRANLKLDQNLEAYGIDESSVLYVGLKL